ncbi:Cell division membrane protein FtsW [Melioribacter roseus P3M-2]|uniref:Probable peptidoglycan glycosyltransferase FtsW n=1 Tax=Melioribacter roseus (strain DSM 23840 / JCM 17771 / VKM B-2668 / P3M-2) TaxID=1191523 RepID=I6ZWX1_MELRP|nr:FtsW/RodA/SpoVE family cell cycle protein [Melioribacter roseus]AFN73558.1 Cell division membrane protein FtsW [Melioribacter roseus P3M-2]
MKTLLKILIILVIALVLLGAIMVFTASGTYSMTRYNDYYSMFKSHILKVVLALFAIAAFALTPYDLFRKYSKYMMISGLVLLIATLIFAPKVKGAARWLDLGLLSFQPSEAVKILLIIHLSALIERKGELIADFKKGFAYALVWIGLVCGLIILQPNVSTSLIIAFTSFVLLYVGGASLRHISGILSVGIFFVGSAVMLYKHSRERLFDYINSLMTGSDINIQVTQAKIALGSGGLKGLGFGHSRQSDLFLPESYGDFIFSIIGEETGFIGTALILFTYLALFVICLIIAKKAQDKFGQLLVFGLGFNILVSAFINAAVVTGLFPTTGITLPFISFGGTSVVFMGVSIGIIINVAYQTMQTEKLKLAQVG